MRLYSFVTASSPWQQGPTLRAADVGDVVELPPERSAHCRGPRSLHLRRQRCPQLHMSGAGRQHMHRAPERPLLCGQHSSLLQFTGAL